MSGRSWQRFAATRPQPGIHDLCSRARTADGRTQPATGARNAIHHVAVDVASSIPADQLGPDPS